MPVSLFSHAVVISLSAPEDVCEASGTILLCVTLETDLERDAEVSLETIEAFATGKYYVTVRTCVHLHLVN